MSYRFRAGEPLQQGVRRVALDRAGRALDALSEGGGAVEGVHDARKRFKEMRALLRLVRAPLGNVYRAENGCFREMGGQLAAARDAEALAETVERLGRRFPDDFGKNDRQTAHRALEQRLTAAGGALPATVEDILKRLREARERIQRWGLSCDGFPGIEAGLWRAYRDGRRRLADAYREGTDEAFHEWRKRIKDHWYHTKLLRPVWEPVMAVRQDQLKVLSELIGHDHDLAVLRQALASEPAVLGDEALGRRVAGLARRYQAELREQARPLGHCLYAEKPAAFVRRIGVYWTEWSRATGPSS